MSDKNYFSSLPDNFFQLLSGTNRELIELSLSALYRRMNYGVSFTVTSEDACACIEELIEDLHIEVQEEDMDFKDAHDSALYILRRMRACGWIEEERGENYQLFLHFRDYAIEIMETMRRINRGESEEYSGYIFTIYQLLRTLDPHNGDVMLERIVTNTEDLFRQLGSLNTNIKKYIQLLLDEKYKDDLQSLMTMLLEDYQTKIVDRAYYNLTTRDHPEKFQSAILDMVKAIGEDDLLLDKLARQRSERKDETYEKALETLHGQLDYVELCFESINDLMDEIDRKNNKYVTSALARITFLLEAHEDLEGKINRILKALISGRIDPENMFALFKSAYFDNQSLYTPKKKRIRIRQSNVISQEPDEEAIAEFLQLLEIEKRFSKTNVEAQLLAWLGDKDELPASKIPVQSFEDFTFLLLGYLYGNDDDNDIEILDLEEKVRLYGYRFTDFLIRRKSV